MNKRQPRFLASFLIAAVAYAGAASAAAPSAAPGSPTQPAELILANGHIKTTDAWVQSLAIREGVIVGLGSDAEVAALRGPLTVVTDLAGATVLPGLHDVHVHPIFAGITERQCKILQGSALADIQRLVRACAAKATPGEWVVGGQWDASVLGAGLDRHTLDAASADRPVVLDDTSGHSAWANSKALAMAGIDRKTPNPPGGIIERDRHGEPTGVLREAATELVKQPIPKPTGAMVRAALGWATREMLAHGITSFTDASVGFVAGSTAELDAYAALADTGVLKQRVTLCLTWAAGSAEAEEAIAQRNRYIRARIAPNCVKIFLDGVPTDSHTAAMLEPYVGTVAGRQDEAARHGLLMVPQPALDAAVTRFDAMGLTVKFHAAGDAAVRAGLNAIAAARMTHGFSGLMHNVGHCTFVAVDDIARARAIGATFEVSPYLWGPTPINDDITKAVGLELIQRVWPVREMIDAGALVVPGSDWSVVPSVNPWIGIETLVTREVPGGSSTSFGKGEAITLPQALELFTTNAARQERMADRVGRIERGMLADVVVLDRDPYAVPITQVHDTQVRMTFVNGEKVFDAAAEK